MTLRPYSARRAWLTAIVTLVALGAVAQVAVTATLLWSGAREGGAQWLHNDTVSSIERINADIADDLLRSATSIAGDALLDEALALDVARLDDARFAEEIGGGRDPSLNAEVERYTQPSAAHRAAMLDPDDTYLFVVGPQREIVGGNNRVCVDRDLSSASPHGLIVCGHTAFLSAHVTVSGGELFVLRPMNERYVDRVADLTLCELQLDVASHSTTSVRAVSDERMSLAISATIDEQSRGVIADFPAPYRGVPAATLRQEEWPARGERHVSFFVNTRPLDGRSDVALSVMIPTVVLTRNLWPGVLALVTVALVLIGLLALIAERLTLKITGPLHRLDLAAQAVARDGAYKDRLPIAGVTEVAGLARSFNAMLDELAASRCRLVQQEKMVAVGQLAAGIAHEINTPLQFTSDNVSFLGRALSHLLAMAARRRDSATSLSASDEKRLARYEDELPKALAGVEEGLRRVSTIVGAMREFSHPSRGPKQLVSLKTLIESTATISRHAWKYVADLDIQVDPGLPAVPVLRDELSQAVLILIVNAADAVEARCRTSGGRGHIVVGAQAHGDRCEISVNDDGVGIAPDHLARVFEPFFTTKAVGKGTGQGLAIAYDIVVEKHKGRIRVESAVNHGATFIIELPTSDPPAAQETSGG